MSHPPWDLPDAGPTFVPIAGWPAFLMPTVAACLHLESLLSTLSSYLATWSNQAVWSSGLPASCGACGPAGTLTRLARARRVPHDDRCGDTRRR
jgi:hypothetical protein